MSEDSLNWIEMLSQINDGQLSVQNDAKMLDGARLQMFRLLKRYRTEGTPAIRYRARGKGKDHKIHKIHKAKRDYAFALVNEKYKDLDLR